MLNYRHVLYPVAIEKGLEKRLEKVINAAKATGTKLTIVHFIKSVSAAYGEIAYYLPEHSYTDLEEDLQSEARNRLNTIVGDQQADNIELTIKSTASIKGDILKMAQQLNVDAIFLNGHKHGPIGRIGSVADSIINKAKCDVVILK